ncbi:MAG: DUF4240 domain-containing protein [Sphingomonadales bacterium]|nr:MAG: DUF4240 domain-containing protein [Sphingomonadales bacterium]
MESFAQLPTSGDPAALAELEDLKAQLKFRSFEEDVDWLLSDLDRKVFNQKGWPAPIAIAYGIILQSYYAQEALEPLAGYYADQHEPIPEGNIRFVEWAIEKGRGDLALFVRKRGLAASRRRFLASLADREKSRALGLDLSLYDEMKASALAAYARMAELLESLGDKIQAEHLRAEHAAFEREEFRKDLSKPSITSIDEVGFWGLLAEWSREHTSHEDAPIALITTLECLSAKALGQVNSIYAKTMRKLYHWNAWALAYVHLGGCSDDSFVEFRDALIAAGDRALVGLAIADPAKAGARLREMEFTPQFFLGPAIEAAMLARTGHLPKQVSTDLAQPKGRAWQEETISEAYPELTALYEPIE